METLLPLIGFAIATSVTPGPNVLMVAASAARHGVRATLPHMLGITAGFGVMLLLVGLGLAGPFARSPELHGVLRVVGAAWLAWIALGIAHSGVPMAGQGRPAMRSLAAALFQWVNPKAWVIAVAAIPAFTTPGGDLLAETLRIAGIFVLVSMPCLGVWAALGGALRGRLGSARAWGWFNRAMALLLLASLIPVFW